MSTLRVKAGLFSNLSNITEAKDRELVFTTDSGEIWIYSGAESKFRLAGRAQLTTDANKGSVAHEAGRFMYVTDKQTLFVSDGTAWHGITVDVSNKMDKVTGATENNLASLNADGEVIDSTFSVSTTPTASTTTVWTSSIIQEKLDELVVGSSWRNSVDTTGTTPPQNPEKGFRILIIGETEPTGDFSTHKNSIGEWTGEKWTYEAPSDGYAVFVEDTDYAYNFNGTEWVSFATAFSYTQGDGIVIEGKQIRVNAASTSSVSVSPTGVDIKTDGVSIIKDETDGSISVGELDFGTF